MAGSHLLPGLLLALDVAAAGLLAPALALLALLAQSFVRFTNFALLTFLGPLGRGEGCLRAL